MISSNLQQPNKPKEKKKNYQIFFEKEEKFNLVNIEM